MMSSKRKLIFLSLFFVSGACGLIYEIVWSRLLVFVFGGTTIAVTTVLACFMGGLALGSFLAGRFSLRVEKPLKLYGVLEIGIGIFCLSVPFLFDLAVPVYRFLLKMAGESFGVLTVIRVIISIGILIIPTSLMGATFPILSKSFVAREGEMGSNVARLYGFNTLGAFVGAAGAGFFLLPRLGLHNSVWLAAILNMGVGTVAVLLSPRGGAQIKKDQVRKKTDKKKADSVHLDPGQLLDRRLLLILYGLSGFAAMAYQVAWTRSLILALGSSTYAFSAIVACFIFGLAGGSFLISTWADTIRNPLGAAGLLEAAMGLSALLVVPLFGEMPEIVRKVVEASNASFEAVLFVEVIYVFALLIVPTLCMGALMPLVCRIYDARPSRAGRSVGDVYASNTAGTILGICLAGFVLIPSKYVGMQNTILLCSAVVGIAATVFILHEKGWHRKAIYAVVSVLWIVGVVAGGTVKPWSKNIMVSGPYLGSGTEQYDVIYYREGADATVAVTAARGSALRALRINGKPDASNEWGDMITQSLLAHVPLLIKPDAKEICNIGLGAGITAGSALAFPVDKVDVIEISSAVVDAARYFEDYNNNALMDPRVRVYLADARNFLLLTDYSYDLIISEPSNPWMSGEANLFTREFFELARSHLNTGGMFCQWIHSYSLKADDFASILKTLSDAFQYVQLWELMSTDFLILGSDDEITVDVEGLYYWFSREPVSTILSSININDPMQMANFYVADGPQLAPWIKDQNVLKDDPPHLEFSAPRYLLENEHGRIIEALTDIEGTPLATGDPNSVLNREFLQRTVKSRNRRKYLHQATISASRRDLEVTFEYLVRAALHGSSDARTAMSLAEELMSFRTLLTSEENQRKVNQAERIISAAIPDFAQFQNAVKGKPASFSWPFSRNIPVPVSQDVQELLLKAKRLIHTKDKREAYEKVREMSGVHPNDPSALALIGKLALEVEGPEEAIPYLLKALLLSPGDNKVNYDLARTYAVTGNRNRSLYFLKAAMENGFVDYQEIESDSVFNSLRNDERFRQLIAPIRS